MEAEPAPDFMLRELQTPPCLDPKSPPEPRAQQTPRTSGFLRTNGRCYPVREMTTFSLVSRSFWPAHQDSVTTLCFLQETPEVSLAQESCWEPKTLGTLGPPSLARDAKNMWTPINQQCCSLGPPGPPTFSSAPPQRRSRKQSNPHRGLEKMDPQFEGVTLRFQIKPDSSLQIIPSYSLACSSRSQGPSAVPSGSPEPSPGGSEALGPRRCASCRTQRTPLWRDAEDGTPLCNACGIRYKKYGTRCSSCWLVPRKNVQSKRLCGRCGMSLGPHQGPTQEG
ncbi:PREDICTED: GATA-type zinc finger protein 1 [Condylura cristata]|uniref:GATA-type zinc finger protein 1 n=1 Tax=Condylura cristata TaxID=143302 RepID=UPI00033448EA|nr:PREDICTED: GATA-type zinc finger protein 1 [Condylura cristata]